MQTLAVHRGRELALLGLLALLWGGSYPLMKISLESIQPITLAAFRVTVAAAILGALVVNLGHQLPREPATWRALFVQAVFNSIGAWTLLAWGQSHIDSALAGIPSASTASVSTSSNCLVASSTLLEN